ncbi:transglycosylase domain-containing protein [Pseudoroseicyclus tamaricis]|uniref:peptidoglycan glycosyltransferase n=1 Tax=Pseudoroseicyclus tamaricis TaxID=2705421 RepID=A0A6B2JWS4_9RHOB|nr:PBP1A family penicillin-binding protein [Pseudoroseicyclus tamaricis]NDV02580.1 PBP1A family penicillin-binding protein [Pseudoroseicyclus tamaricis]
MANNSKRPPLVADRRYPGKSAEKKAERGRQGGKPGPKAASSSGGGRKGRAPKAARQAPRRRRGPVGWVLGFFAFIGRLLWGVGWRVGVAFGLFLGGAVLIYAAGLPDVDELVDGRARGSVTLTDRDGATYAWRGEQYGGMITADTVSRHLKNAVVATEDRRFYRHFGISPRGMLGAVRINMSEGRGPLEGHGGSTITQQTAKLLCLGRPFDPAEWESEAEYEADCRRTTLWRKAVEAVYAMAMEAKYTKDEILTIYLNRAYLGAGARGFEAAAQLYFGHSAAEVTPAEGAMLAGLLKAPSSYAPTNSLTRAQDRANLVVGLMEEQGYLSQSAAAEARANPATLSQAAAEQRGGYFADWVMDSGPEFFTRDTTEDVIIRTTLEPRIQRAAEDAITTIFETKVADSSNAQAAIVVMSADGAVRAMVGGRDVGASFAFNRATQALRQTGSTFKPFSYAAALDLGASPMDMIEDTPITIDVPGSGPWSPSNYDHEFEGSITLLQALRESRNVPAVRVAMRAGLENVRLVAHGFGIDRDLADGPALALGASEATLLEMTGAYAGILNGGSSVTPYGIVDLRFQGNPEPLMTTRSGIGERVIRESAARQLTYMMHDVVENGTGGRARVDGWELAGKTGTTSAARDAWFIGFSADYVVGVWMGYDDNTPLTGVTGSGLPAEIWHEAMARILAPLTPTPLPMDAPIAARDQSAAAVEGTLDNILGGGGSNAAAPANPGATASSDNAGFAPATPAPQESSGSIRDALNAILGGG